MLAETDVSFRQLATGSGLSLSWLSAFWREVDRRDWGIRKVQRLHDHLENVTARDEAA